MHFREENGKIKAWAYVRDFEQDMNLSMAIYDNGKLAQTSVVQNNRPGGSLEKGEVKYFIIGRAKAPVEVAAQCGKLAGGYDKLD